MTTDTIDFDQTLAGEERTLLAGRYRVVRQLGQGGMGSVWLAEDSKLDGHKVAVKMLPSVLVNNKRAYAQVKAEALVSLKLSHPNIATVRAFEEENGNPFLVMDYIDGQTLDDYLAEKGTLTEDETVKLLKPVAAALDYAHTQGVVHRDVKPGNVMIRKDGTPFVLDFGIAREIQETMTRVTGKLSSGTLLYMSPEQLNGDAPKPAQDIYSFAAMAYECLKGEPPFSRGGVEDQIKHKLPDALGEHIAICSQVMAGLAKSPEGRPRCCAAVLEKGGRKAAKTGAGASASKMRIAVVGALLALAALVGVGGWFGWSAYCRAEENRLATIKAEMGRKAAWRRLELETDRLASQVNEAQRVSEREQFANREGLKARAAEMEEAAKSGRLALSTTNLVSATNWFHIALSCSDWLSSNAVLHAQCMLATKEALKARKAADEADAKSLASNEYVRAIIAFGQADEGLKAARFEEARSRWMKAAGLFEDAERNAMSRKKAEAGYVVERNGDDVKYRWIPWRVQGDIRTSEMVGVLEGRQICVACNGIGTEIRTNECLDCSGRGYKDSFMRCDKCHGGRTIPQTMICPRCTGGKTIKTRCDHPGSLDARALSQFWDAEQRRSMGLPTGKLCGHVLGCPECQGFCRDMSGRTVQKNTGSFIGIDFVSNEMALCGRCKGYGYIRCPGCFGEGEKTAICPECKGRGSWLGNKTCSTCAGTGLEKKLVRCSKCKDGKRVESVHCAICSGNGYEWKPLEKGRAKWKP